MTTHLNPNNPSLPNILWIHPNSCIEIPGVGSRCKVLNRTNQIASARFDFPKQMINITQMSSNPQYGLIAECPFMQNCVYCISGNDGEIQGHLLTTLPGESVAYVSTPLTNPSLRVPIINMTSNPTDLLIPISKIQSKIALLPPLPAQNPPTPSPPTIPAILLSPPPQSQPNGHSKRPQPLRNKETTAGDPGHNRQEPKRKKGDERPVVLDNSPSGHLICQTNSSPEAEPVESASQATQIDLAPEATYQICSTKTITNKTNESLTITYNKTNDECSISGLVYTSHIKMNDFSDGSYDILESPINEADIFPLQPEPPIYGDAPNIFSPEPERYQLVPSNQNKNMLFE